MLHMRDDLTHSLQSSRCKAYLDRRLPGERFRLHIDPSSRVSRIVKKVQVILKTYGAADGFQGLNMF